LLDEADEAELEALARLDLEERCLRLLMAKTG